ncbi:MAG TPA: MerC domain-containing protein [Sphingomonas sp.]|nr:MerC domain-containing protein [Sphingomonas sp.]
MHHTDHHPAVSRSRSGEDMLDGFAMCASAVCMVHCLAVPVLLAALPALATWFHPGEYFHWAILAFAVPTSALALIGGWRLHRAVVPVVFGALGLILMTLGVVFAAREAIETALSVSGSLSLAFAHIANWHHRFACSAMKG